jgi:hypothetical protein
LLNHSNVHFDCSGLDVQSIIRNWYRELAEDAREFERQAERMNTWDKQLYENRKVSVSICSIHL